jgi:3-hydroxybutyrate dehydrogenase
MLHGKTAIVTGSTSGIGLGVARSLAEAGCNVVLNGFGEADAIESERARIEKEFDVQAIFDPANLEKPDAIARMIEIATREFGKVDILVNNAGIQHTALIENFPVDRWEAVIANFPCYPSSYPSNADAQLGPHHQYRLDAWLGGVG